MTCHHTYTYPGILPAIYPFHPATAREQQHDLSLHRRRAMRARLELWLPPVRVSGRMEEIVGIAKGVAARGERGAASLERGLDEVEAAACITAGARLQVQAQAFWSHGGRRRIQLHQLVHEANQEGAGRRVLQARHEALSTQLLFGPCARLSMAPRSESTSTLARRAGGRARASRQSRASSKS